MRQLKVFSAETYLIIKSDVSRPSLWAYYQGERTVGPWSDEERKPDINGAKGSKISNSSHYLEQETL